MGALMRKHVLAILLMWIVGCGDSPAQESQGIVWLGFGSAPTDAQVEEVQSRGGVNVTPLRLARAIVFESSKGAAEFADVPGVVGSRKLPGDFARPRSILLRTVDQPVAADTTYLLSLGGDIALLSSDRNEILGLLPLSAFAALDDYHRFTQLVLGLDDAVPQP